MLALCSIVVAINVFKIPVLRYCENGARFKQVMLVRFFESLQV